MTKKEANNVWRMLCILRIFELDDKLVFTVEELELMTDGDLRKTLRNLSKAKIMLDKKNQSV